MTSHVLRRLVESAIVIAVMSFVIYGLIGLMPGDPIDLMLGADPHLSSADVARLKTLYGVDRPLGERYLAWAQAVLHGNFGYSRLFSLLFQAEDGIRDHCVTGVQTCALPI